MWLCRQYEENGLSEWERETGEWLAERPPEHSQLCHNRWGRCRRRPLLSSEDALPPSLRPPARGCCFLVVLPLSVPPSVRRNASSAKIAAFIRHQQGCQNIPYLVLIHFKEIICRSICSGPGNNNCTCTWFGEVCSCCCLHFCLNLPVTLLQPRTSFIYRLSTNVLEQVVVQAGNFVSQSSLPPSPLFILVFSPRRKCGRRWWRKERGRKWTKSLYFSDIRRNVSLVDAVGDYLKVTSKNIWYFRPPSTLSLSHSRNISGLLMGYIPSQFGRHIGSSLREVIPMMRKWEGRRAD